MNVENGNTAFRGKGNHSSLAGKILQELHTTNFYKILTYEDLRTFATQF